MSEHENFEAAWVVAHGKALLAGVIVVILLAGGWFWQQRQAEDLDKVHTPRSNAAAVSKANAEASAKLNNGYAKTPAGALNIPIDRAMEVVAKELK